MKNNIFPKNIEYGSSKKPDGNMRVFLDENENKKTEKNRKKFFKKKKIDYSSIVFAELIHEDKIKIVKVSDKGKIIRNTDALITNDSKITLTSTSADCLIIFLYDKDKKVIALIHAGWRGLLKNIITKTVKKMNLNFKTKSKDIKVLFSPHIQKCHFIIKEDILKQFNQYNQFIEKNKKISVDLSAIAKKQLLEQNVLEKNIKINPECTYCLKNKYYSFRRSKSKKLKTMIAYIRFKNHNIHKKN